MALQRKNLKEIEKIFNFFKKFFIENFQNSQDEGANELMETNRNLSAAMDKMELRC